MWVDINRADRSRSSTSSAHRTPIWYLILATHSLEVDAEARNPGRSCTRPQCPRSRELKEATGLSPCGDGDNRYRDRHCPYCQDCVFGRPTDSYETCNSNPQPKRTSRMGEIIPSNLLCPRHRERLGRGYGREMVQVPHDPMGNQRSRI